MGDISLRIHFLCLLCIYGLPRGASTARNDYKKGVIFEKVDSSVKAQNVIAILALRCLFCHRERV